MHATSRGRGITDSDIHGRGNCESLVVGAEHRRRYLVIFLMRSLQVTVHLVSYAERLLGPSSKCPTYNCLNQDGYRTIKTPHEIASPHWLVMVLDPNRDGPNGMVRNGTQQLMEHEGQYMQLTVCIYAQTCHIPLHVHIHGTLKPDARPKIRLSHNLQLVGPGHQWPETARLGHEIAPLAGTKRNRALAVERGRHFIP